MDLEGFGLTSDHKKKTLEQTFCPPGVKFLARFTKYEDFLGPLWHVPGHSRVKVTLGKWVDQLKVQISKNQGKSDELFHKHDLD